MGLLVWCIIFGVFWSTTNSLPESFVSPKLQGFFFCFFPNA